MLHFCTYFDRNYLPRGVALYESLQANCPPFTLWILCMDSACHGALERAALPGVRTIALEEFERGDAALLEAKGNRTPIEYYFTCTASLPLFIFRNHPDVDVLTYLDADLYFFADPTPIFEELGGGSIGVIEHGAAASLPELEVYGRFNVGWITIRRDENGLECLGWWRERCIEWCYDRAEDGKFAEQKYLDEWPARFQGVVVLRHPGANVAPWNLAHRPIRRDITGLRVSRRAPRDAAGGGEGPLDAAGGGEGPLLFFHFHGFRRVARWLYDPNLSQYRARVTPTIKRYLYAPYIRAVLAATGRIAPFLERLTVHEGIRKPLAGPWWKRAAERFRRLARVGFGVAAGRYIVARNRDLS